LHLPITPLHYPIAKIIHLLDGKVSLSLPALIVGSFVPDLEVPFVYFLSGTWSQDRMVLHSLIGGLTLGTLIAVAFTVLVYPRLIGAILPIDKKRVKEKCSFSLMLVFSGLLGVLSHVLLDVFNHAYNPLFWPFLSLFQAPSPIVPLLGGPGMASTIVEGIMLLLFVLLAVKNRSNFWERLFVG
jgi:membrane-bound metal-dependent hydrolase YbcI (DUF457 family)